MKNKKINWKKVCSDFCKEKWLYEENKITINQRIRTRKNGEEYMRYVSIIPAKVFGGGKRDMREWDSFEAAEEHVLPYIKDTKANALGLTPTEIAEAFGVFTYIKERELPDDVSLMSLVQKGITAWDTEQKSKPLFHAIDEYMEELQKEGKRLKTLSQYNTCMQLLKNSLPDNPLVSSITTDMMRDIANKNLSNHEPITWNNYRRSWICFFNFGMESDKSRNWHTLNPAKGITRKHVDDKDPVILTLDEVKEHLRACIEDEQNRDYHIICYIMQLFVGPRFDEVHTKAKDKSKPDWKNMNLKSKKYRIPKEIAKKRRNRNCTIPPNAMEFLKPLWKESGPLIPMYKYNERLTDLRRKLGYEDWNGTHKNALRHTFATNHLVLHGEEATRAAMGHSERNTEQLFENYRALMEDEDEAHEFFQITPESLGITNYSEKIKCWLEKHRK